MQISLKEISLTWTLSIGILTGFPTIIFIVASYIYPKSPVDKNNCICQCFDTIFRGPFGSQSYRSIFVNATVQSYFVYLLFVVHILVWYEAIKYLVRLLCDREYRAALQIRFLALIAVAIYPNFYTWWTMFIYINNSMHNFILHQLVFGAGEIVLAIIDFWHLLPDQSSAKIITPSSQISHPRTPMMLVGLGVAINHVVFAALDENLLQFELKSRKGARDVFLIIPDLLHVLVFGIALYRSKAELTRNRHLPLFLIVLICVGLVTYFS